MNYDFSTETDRRNTGSVKWSGVKSSDPDNFSYPLSMADMEFVTPPEIRKACTEFAERGFYCYTGGDNAYRKDVCDFMLRRHNWEIKPEWIVNTFGIVGALHTAVKAFTEEGDGIITTPPVYAHFYHAARYTGRTLVNVPLVIENNRYEINFGELEKACKNPKNKMLIFCSPHNPTGRVWTREELKKTVKLCKDNGVFIVSDEIHFDITCKEHTVIATVGDYSENCMICTAISKSFNIAGLATSNIIIPSDEKRELFSRQLTDDGYSCINAFAYPATHAAYNFCDEWLDNMNAVINRNFEIFEKALREDMPKIGFCPREGTYLAWLDVSCFNIPEGKDYSEFFEENTGFIPQSGDWFEGNGNTHIRANLAIPESTLMRFIASLKECYDKFV